MVPGREQLIRLFILAVGLEHVDALLVDRRELQPLIPPLHVGQITVRDHQTTRANPARGSDPVERLPGPAGQHHHPAVELLHDRLYLPKSLDLLAGNHFPDCK